MLNLTPKLIQVIGTVLVGVLVLGVIVTKMKSSSRVGHDEFPFTAFEYDPHAQQEILGKRSTLTC